MAPRKRLTLAQKSKLIEDSMQPGFDKSKAMIEYGISKPGLNLILHLSSLNVVQTVLIVSNCHNTSFFTFKNVYFTTSSKQYI